MFAPPQDPHPDSVGSHQPRQAEVGVGEAGRQGRMRAFLGSGRWNGKYINLFLQAAQQAKELHVLSMICGFGHPC